MSRAEFDSLDFRRACGLFTTGVAVLTTRAADGSPHGLTVNSFSSLSLEPPLVMVAIDRICAFLNHFESSGFYAVNVLREKQLDISKRFAELPEGRFTGVAWHEGTTGSPIIENCLCVIECTTMNVMNAGDHRALLGEVVNVEMGEGRPLVFYNGGYTTIPQ